MPHRDRPGNRDALDTIIEMFQVQVLCFFQYSECVLGSADQTLRSFRSRASSSRFSSYLRGAFRICHGVSPVADLSELSPIFLNSDLQSLAGSFPDDAPPR